jgi:RNA polymerase sigma factor (TIGR02999 family)
MTNEVAPGFPFPPQSRRLAPHLSRRGIPAKKDIAALLSPEKIPATHPAQPSPYPCFPEIEELKPTQWYNWANPYFSPTRGPVQNAHENEPNDEPGDVTQLLFAMRQGDPHAEEQLFRILYRELRRMAANHLRGESPDHTLQPTALVHEAYIRMTRQQDVDWQCRSHFLAVASTVMKHILIDHARAQMAKKRGERLQVVSFNDGIFALPVRPDDYVALEEALNELAKIFPTHARMVEMKFFAYMTEKEIGQVQGKDPRTVRRDWKFARNWLITRLNIQS